LSGAAFLLLGLTGWMGGELVFRHRLGMSGANRHLSDPERGASRRRLAAGRAG